MEAVNPLGAGTFITDALARLDNAKAGKEVFAIRKQELIDSIYTEEIKQNIKDIEAEFSADVEHIDLVISTLTEEIKTAAIAHGESVKGDNMKVTFVKGRVTWDSKGLAGYAVANPEVLKFKKVGNPSARIGSV